MCLRYDTPSLARVSFTTNNRIMPPLRDDQASTRATMVPTMGSRHHSRGRRHTRAPARASTTTNCSSGGQTQHRQPTIGHHTLPRATPSMGFSHSSITIHRLRCRSSSSTRHTTPQPLRSLQHRTSSVRTQHRSHIDNTHRNSTPTTRPFLLPKRAIHLRPTILLPTPVRMLLSASRRTLDMAATMIKPMERRPLPMARPRTAMHSHPVRRSHPRFLNRVVPIRSRPTIINKQCRQCRPCLPYRPCRQIAL